MHLQVISTDLSSNVGVKRMDGSSLKASLLVDEGGVVVLVDLVDEVLGQSWRRCWRCGLLDKVGYTVV